jgi:hypothetical protein
MTNQCSAISSELLANKSLFLENEMLHVHTPAWVDRCHANHPFEWRKASPREQAGN